MPMLPNNNRFKLNGELNAIKHPLRLNGRVNLLDFPKFGGIRCLEAAPHSSSLPFPYFSDLRYVWNTPVLYEYPSIRNEVLNSQRVQLMIGELVDAGHGTFETISFQAQQFFDGIRSSISKIWTRFLGWAMFKIFRRLMKSLLISPDQLNSLKKAHDTGIPIVYLPLHKSHMDYQIITWVVWHFNLRVQNVAAGDNLNLSGFGWLLRATGAFFIKRHTDPDEQSTRDVLYRSVLKSYLIELLKSGQSLEFFLEGTRSRMGKTLLPKNGLISNIVEAVENGEFADAYLVPVSINYDALIEGIFYDQLVGIRKPKENIINVFRGIINCFRREHPCGIVTVDFGEPTLLSKVLQTIKESATHQGLDYATNFNSYRELLPWNDHSINHKTLIRAVGYHLVYTAHRQKPIGIPALISILFLCKYRTQPVTMSELANDLSNLVDEIQRLKHEVVGWFAEETIPDDLILANIYYLGNAVKVSKSNNDLILSVNDCHESWITFAYHKNNALSPLTLISIAAIVSKLKPVQTVKQMQTLCLLLRYEVLLCSPLDSLEERATESLEYFAENKNAFSIDFYPHLILPFMETLLYVASYILEHPTEFNKLSDVAFIRQTVVRMAADQSLKYREAANSDSVYNSLKALRIWGAANEVSVELLSEYLMNQIIKQLRFFYP